MGMLSSQDTTVWRFVTDSKYFKGIECITIQDFAYLLLLNAANKSDRRNAKGLYNQYAREEHPFEIFKEYIERNGDKIPQYIRFENNRIRNYYELVEEYIAIYCDTSLTDASQIISEIVRLASSNTGTCLSCIFSRPDKNKIDFSIRKCVLDYSFNDENCLQNREEFTQGIRKSERH